GNCSNGQYVGQIDYSDSYVQFTVNVATTKSYTMTIRYANGTGANSTHNLSINGGTASTVTYSATGNWFHSNSGASLTRSVNLNAGNNTIRFTKGATGYAELDYIDIQ
ncbi:MAG TPA: CBM35 domain-containing protein, partial [Bacillota bacterium]|nr:CBM35 domain-containing protein [Bacillota bacterium]